MEFNKVSGRVDGVKAVQAFTSSPVSSYISITSGALAPILAAVSHFKPCLPSRRVLSDHLHSFRRVLTSPARAPPPTNLVRFIPPRPRSYHIKSSFDKYSSHFALVTVIARFWGMSQQLKVCMDVCVSMITSEGVRVRVCVCCPVWMCVRQG